MQDGPNLRGCPAGMGAIVFQHRKQTAMVEYMPGGRIGYGLLCIAGLL